MDKDRLLGCRKVHSSKRLKLIATMSIRNLFLKPSFFIITLLLIVGYKKAGSAPEIANYTFSVDKITEALQVGDTTRLTPVFKNGNVQHPVNTKSDGIIRILAIGNSFSVDAIENYLYDLAHAAGKKVIIGSLAIGGGTLEQHVANAQGNLTPYYYTKIDVDGAKTTTADNAIEPILKSEKWDYISFQQVSQHSGMYTSFTTPLPALAAYVKARATNKKVKYVLHQTWAYAQHSSHSGFANYGNNQQTMYEAIVETYNKAQQLIKADIIIPVGTAIQNGRTSFIGDNFTRDGYHLEETYARYTAACTWFQKIFGETVVGNTFKPSTITDYYKEVAQQAANLAVLEPNKVTVVENYQQGEGGDADKGLAQLNFNSRAGVTDNRETLYTSEGSNEVIVKLNSAGDTKNVVCAESVQPNEQGEALVTITMGSASSNLNGFYYRCVKSNAQIDSSEEGLSFH